MTRTFLAALLISSALPAYAANFEVTKGEVTQMTIKGEIDPNDFDAFKLVANAVALLGKPVLVDLESPGGNLIAALQIGEYIRAKRWGTSVYDECDSACAAIWLAGVLRYMSPIARIGFHAASVNGQEKGNGNALVGAYMTRLGLGYGAVLWATTASPKDIAYLTPSKAKQLRIEVTVIDPDEPKQANAQPTLPPPQVIAPQPVTPFLGENICAGRLWVNASWAAIMATHNFKGPNACYFAPRSNAGKQVLSVCDEWGDNATHGCWIKGVMEDRPESERELMQVVEVKKVTLADLAALPPPMPITPRPATPANAEDPYKEGTREYYSGLCYRARPYLDGPPEKAALWESGFRDAQRRDQDRVDRSYCFPGRTDAKPDLRDCSAISAEMTLFFPDKFDDCYIKPAANASRLYTTTYATQKTWDRYIPSSGRYITRTLEFCTSAQCVDINGLTANSMTKNSYRLVAKDHDNNGGSNGGSVCYFTSAGWSDCETNMGEHYQLRAGAA
jgi:hypothetical protein